MTPTYDPTENEDSREARLKQAAISGAEKAIDESGLLIVVIAKGGTISVAGVIQPFEYFCFACGQLRLFAKNPEPFDGCGGCGNDGMNGSIVAAAPGHLDKEELTRLRDALST